MPLIGKESKTLFKHHKLLKPEGTTENNQIQLLGFMEEVQAHFVTSKVIALVSRDGEGKLTTESSVLFCFSWSDFGRQSPVSGKRSNQKQKPDQMVRNRVWSYQSWQASSLWGSRGSGFGVCWLLSTHTVCPTSSAYPHSLPLSDLPTVPRRLTVLLAARARQWWSARPSSFVPLWSPLELCFYWVTVAMASPSVFWQPYSIEWSSFT